MASYSRKKVFFLQNIHNLALLQQLEEEMAKIVQNVKWLAFTFCPIFAIFITFEIWTKNDNFAQIKPFFFGGGSIAERKNLIFAKTNIHILVRFYFLPDFGYFFNN